MPLLEVSGLRKFYRSFCALDEVSLTVADGQFVSIIGPNGAGKTTLINVLTGLLKPNAGRVFFKDQDITGAGPVKLSRLGMVRSFQLVNIFPALTVLEVIKVAVVSRLGRGGRLFASLARDREVNGQAREVAELFALAEKADTPAKNLPQGDKKLLDVASAFALYPEVILLDEPTSGVSTREKHTIMDILVSASKRIGIKSIIQVEHDMDIVFGYSDRIIALHQGKLLADGRPDEIKANEAVVNTVVGKKEWRRVGGRDAHA